MGFSVFLMLKSPSSINKFKGADHSFKLNTISGKITNETFKGKVIVLFFGYTNCPDICPTALTDISNAFKNLTQKEKKNTQIIFVSVDPSRDNLKDLNNYVKYFNKNFIGATSDTKTLKNLTQRFYAYYSYEKQKNSAVGYSVSHTTRIYILNKNGKLVNTLSSTNVKISNISDVIKKVL
jgi:protein SCO1/2